MLRASGWLLTALLVLLVCAWTLGALWYDLPLPALPRKIAAISATTLLLWLWFGRCKHGRIAALTALAMILAWWFSLKPSNERPWIPEVAQVGWADIQGDVVTLHNVRNFEYRTATESTPRWETRTVHLSKLTGVDIALCYWGSPWMAHPLISFQFADAPPVCFSIETRKEVGESYSAIGGLYRQYELTYIVADERDVIRVRSNYRQGEDVYLYEMTLTPVQARRRFLEYLETMNALRVRPRWYNAITTNCTTSIRSQHDAQRRIPWDWRILLNGKGDELLYEIGALRTGGQPFAQLKAGAHINAAAREADQDPDFSQKIRRHLNASSP